MNDQSKKKIDSDDQFARELERRHKDLIGDESGPSQHLNQNERNDDERIQSAMLILEMLEKLKMFSTLFARSNTDYYILL